MSKYSRRQVIGSVAAAAIAGTGIAAARPGKSPKGAAVKTMTLEEFQSMGLPESAVSVLARMDCSNFSKCHEDMRRKHGIWIPELVPVFAKLDAQRAGSSM